MEAFLDLLIKELDDDPEIKEKLQILNCLIVQGVLSGVPYAIYNLGKTIDRKRAQKCSENSRRIFDDLESNRLSSW